MRLPAVQLFEIGNPIGDRLIMRIRPGPADHVLGYVEAEDTAAPTERAWRANQPKPRAEIDHPLASEIR